MPDLPDETQNLDGTQPVNLPEWKPTPSVPDVEQAPPAPPPDIAPQWTPPPRSPEPEPLTAIPSDVSVTEWKPTTRTPTPAGGHVQEPSKRYDRKSRKRKSGDRKRSGFYLPAWSVAVMLLLVFGITGAIVMLVITLGGQTPAEGEPRIVIITAEPSATPQELPTAVDVTLAPTVNTQGTVPTFALEGPTLQPIILSPTPIAITIGSTVIVNVDGLNIRESAGTDSKRVDSASDGERFTVIGGPEQASSLTWWQIQDPSKPDRQGWAAADYLEVATGSGGE